MLRLWDRPPMPEIQVRVHASGAPASPSSPGSSPGSTLPGTTAPGGVTPPPIAPRFPLIAPSPSPQVSSGASTAFWALLILGVGGLVAYDYSRGIVST